MPRVTHYPSDISFPDTVGHVLSLPAIAGTAWYMPRGHSLYSSHGEITLMSLPCGHRSYVPWSTLRKWIDKGSVEVGAEYPTWQDAAAALYPRDMAEGMAV